MSDAASMVPRGWDIGPTIPMGPSLGPVETPDPMGISTKGDLYTYIQATERERERSSGVIPFGARLKYFYFLNSSFYGVDNFLTLMPQAERSDLS